MDRKALNAGPGARWAWLFLVLAALALYPTLTQPVELLAYDAAREHVVRAAVFSQAITDGALYPRWTQSLNWGLGGPLFTFQPPLPYYAMDLLYRLGIPHTLGWRILMATGLLAAGLGAYALIYALTRRRWPALAAGIAYLYAPYVIRNALERGSNEAFSMFLYPWVLWGLLRLGRKPSAARFSVATEGGVDKETSRQGRKPSPGRFIVATLLWAACIACHVLAPLMLVPFAGLLALALWRRCRTALPLLALLAGGLLTAFIWLPMAPEQAWVHVERDFNHPEAIPADNPIPLDNLLAPPAVYDTQSDGNNTGDRVGILQTLFLVAAVPATVYAWSRRRRELALALACATVAGLVLFWMFTAASDPLWRALGPLLARLLYRTRLMGLEALAAAAACGLALAVLPRRWQPFVGCAVVALTLLAAVPSLYVGLQHRWASYGPAVQLSDARRSETEFGLYGLTAFSEFTPRWQSEEAQQAECRAIGPTFDAGADPLANLPPDARVISSRVSSSAWDLDLQSARPAALTLHLLYYPRWQASIDGQPVTLRPDAATGYAQLDLPAGSHHVALRYGSTPAETAGLVVSGATLALLAGFGLWPARWRLARLKTAAPRTATGSEPVPADDADEAPAGWRAFALPALLTLLLVVKVAYVDGHTSLFRCVSTAEHVCGAQATADATFAGGIHLRGYTVSSAEVRRGKDLQVTAYWQLERPIERPLRTFVHIRNSQKGWPVDPKTGSDIWTQALNVTPSGYLATDLLPGRFYADGFQVAIPADMPSGEYFLEIGWSDAESGEQLDVDHVQPPLRVLWRSLLLPNVTVR